MIGKVTVTLNLDFEELVESKLELVKKAWENGETDSPLEGIINLIDEIQDQAVSENGFTDEQVFGKSLKGEY